MLHSIAAGKTIPTASPAVSLPPAAPATNPITVGPPAHPRSPASAISANIAVPLPGIAGTAVLNVPGQKMPTENAHAQPTQREHGELLHDGLYAQMMHDYGAGWLSLLRQRQVAR